MPKYIAVNKGYFCQSIFNVYTRLICVLKFIVVINTNKTKPKPIKLYKTSRVFLFYTI